LVTKDSSTPTGTLAEALQLEAAHQLEALAGATLALGLDRLLGEHEDLGRRVAQAKVRAGPHALEAAGKVEDVDDRQRELVDLLGAELLVDVAEDVVVALAVLVDAGHEA
jgi:hypothetical protein